MKMTANESFHPARVRVRVRFRVRVRVDLTVSGHILTCRDVG